MQFNNTIEKSSGSIIVRSVQNSKSYMTWHIDYIMTQIQHSAAVHDDNQVWNKYKQQILPLWKFPIDVFYYCSIPEQKETYKWKTKKESRLF